MKHIPLRGLYAPELLESRIAPATFLVTTLADAGAGSLREAIGFANAAASADTITFSPALFPGGAPGLITLTTGEIGITDTLTIKGPGIDRLTISGNDASRIFNINDGNGAVLHPASISGLTLLDGSAGAGNNGGAIRSTESLSLAKVVVHSNTAGGAGGGVFVDTTGKVRIDSTHFTDNTATTGAGGGLYAFADGGILVTRCLVSGNTSAKSGGGMYLRADPKTASILVDGSTFISNDAGIHGGGMQLHRKNGGTATVRNSTFTGNTATLDGGALYLEVGRMIVDRCVFSGNSAGSEGGAIARGGPDSLVIKNSRFDGNSADSGGALYLNGAQAVTITGSAFTGNKSTVTSGGAIHAQGGIVLTVKTSSFFGNTTTANGGAIALTGTGTSLLLAASTVSGNAGVEGGGIYAGLGAKLTVTGGTFIGNSASIGGGGIHTTGTGASAVDVSITGTLFQGNRADRGGAVETDGDGTVLVKAVRVIGNLATSNDGGGMYLRSASSLIVQSSLFSHNVAGDDGGGLIMDSTGAAVSRIIGTKFLDNYSGDEGGGFAIFGGTVEIKSSVITGNVAALRGGGVAQDGGTATFIGTTPTGNWAPTFPNIFP